MSRYAALDLSQYPISDILSSLDYEAGLSAMLADFSARWEVLRATSNSSLPIIDTLLLESEPVRIILQVMAYREMLLKAHVNDTARSLSLSGALGSALDHIGITYYRTPRRVMTESLDGAPAVMEDDETYRQRLALAPESWSTAGPIGAYVFWALSASPDVLDIAAYSEDEGVCLAPRVRIVILSHQGNGVASPALIQTVQAALNRREIRPLADQVTVESAVLLPFDLTINLKLRSGASPAIVMEAARARVLAFCSGRTRWAGDGVVGPTWLIGRTLTSETIAAAASGGDANILEVDVVGGDINPVHPNYTEAALFGVGTDAFQPLNPTVTAHLFKAPRLGALTLNHSFAVTGWTG